MNRPCRHVLIEKDRPAATEATFSKLPKISLSMLTLAVKVPKEVPRCRTS